MSIWTNRQGANTNWSNDDDSTTASWATKTGNAPNQLYGSVDSNTPVSGTYTSSAKATASVVGGKYHLFDDVDFRLGTDSDFTFRYDKTLDGFNLNSSVDSENFFTVTKDDTEIFGISSSGVLRLSGGFQIAQVESLSENPANGRLTFYSNNLWVAK